MADDRAPRTIWLVILLWAAMLALQLTQEFPRGDGQHDAYENVSTVAWTIMLIGFLAAALLGRSRLGWGVVLLAQVHWATNGAYNLAINDYPFDWIIQMRQIPFYYGGLPLVIGFINIVLLLLPAARQWSIGTPRPAVVTGPS